MIPRYTRPEIGGDGGDGEDAAARGDEVAVLGGGAGVEDDYVFRWRRRDAVDEFA